MKGFFDSWLPSSFVCIGSRCLPVTLLSSSRLGLEGPVGVAIFPVDAGRSDASSHDPFEGLDFSSGRAHYLLAAKPSGTSGLLTY